MKLSFRIINHEDTKTLRFTKQYIGLLCVLCAFVVQSIPQKEVPQQVMQKIYDEVKTPYKYGLVVTPENDSKKNRLPFGF